MMIHKIDPHKYYPEFRNQEPKPSDYLLLFDGEKYFCPPIQETTLLLRVLPRMKVL